MDDDDDNVPDWPACCIWCGNPVIVLYDPYCSLECAVRAEAESDEGVDDDEED